MVYPRSRQPKLVISRSDVPTTFNGQASGGASKHFCSAPHLGFRAMCVPRGWPPVKSRNLEILKQSYLDQRFIILDEPTVLTPTKSLVSCGRWHNGVRSRC
jgi:hypothetical protein